MNKQDVRRIFGGRLVGNDEMKHHVIEIVSRLPEQQAEFIAQNVWFFASMDDAWAFTFTGNDLKDNHLIFLSDDLLNQDEDQIHYTIAHEIGHVVLGHRNSVTVRQTKEEIMHQEQEADLFAREVIQAV